MYVFGYGSLLWYTDFPYVHAIPGVVHGYVRRFWQHSPDHRGTPDKPGRTVTLVPSENGQAWGLAYKIPDEAIESTFAYLDFRERAGYRCEKVRFNPDDGSEPFDLCVYISLEHADNPYHAGPADMSDIVRTIVTSKGRSGTNLEYALRLADCQRRMAPYFRDDHLFTLEELLLEACARLQVQDSILLKLGHRMPYLSAFEENLPAEEKRDDRLPIVPISLKTGAVPLSSSTTSSAMPLRRLQVVNGSSRRG